MYNLVLSYHEQFPAISIPKFAIGLLGDVDPAQAHEAWRYLLISGLIPAMPLILIRPFLPESPVWASKKAAGLLKRPSIRELFAPRYRRTTIVTTLMFACSYGVAFGAIQQFQHMAAGVPQVKEATANKPVPQQKEIEGKAVQKAGFVQEIGGLAGRFLLAILALQIVSRRKLLRVFLWPNVIAVPLVFGICAVQNFNWYLVGIFFVGLFTVSQFSFWGNYLPRVYPVHLRGTGEGFAANIGGRMLGTACAALTTWLSVQSFIPGEAAPTKMAYSAAIVAGSATLLGAILTFFLPEPGLADIEE
jgi:hypothetical protein